MSICNTLPGIKRDKYTELLLLAVEARQEAEQIIFDNQRYPLTDQTYADRHFAAKQAQAKKNLYWEYIKESRDYMPAEEYPTPEYEIKEEMYDAA
tara:strand:- start:1593 stop:1877 length:285 start_codon:yes stop_codon:yes gene_type:complete